MIIYYAMIEIKLNNIGEARIYAHQELIEMIRTLARTLLQAKQTKHIDERLLFIPIEDGEEREIIGHTVKFFDIQATKDKQFGFTISNFYSQVDDKQLKFAVIMARSHGRGELKEETIEMLFIAEIYSFEEALHSEMEKIIITDIVRNVSRYLY